MATEPVAFYPSEVRVMPLTLIQCERRLPSPGEVLVHPGQRVEPTQVVARTHQAQDFRILDVARRLHVSRSEVNRLVIKKAGDIVEANEPLTRRKGLFGSPVSAPVQGKIIAVGNGRILLEVAQAPIDVPAFLKGTVANVWPSRGVLIEAPGAIIQGTWGCGSETSGVLRVVAEKPEEPLRAKAIDVACHGAIVIGGAWIEASALEQAQQLQVRGLIAGSMDGELRAQAEAAPFVTILTEGFGHVPMADPIFQLLHAQSGREASISAGRSVRGEAGPASFLPGASTRPQILVPLPTESRPAPPPPPGAPLMVGMRVRVVRPPYAGAVGIVSAIPSQAQRLETGARVPGAQIDLAGDTGVVFVPYVNLELVR